MRPGTAREPSIVAAALARSDVLVQLIADLQHVAPDTVRVAWAAARGRVALVSDAVAAAGAGDGEFSLGGRVLHAAGGVVRGPEGDRPAGSAITLLDAVRNLVSLGIAPAEALHAATALPARIARRPDLGPARARRAGRHRRAG